MGRRNERGARKRAGQARSVEAGTEVVEYRDFWYLLGA